MRVTAQSLNRLMGLAGESLVQARWLPSFSTALLKLKKQHDLLASMLDAAYHAAAGGMPPDQLADLIADTRRQWGACRQELNEKTHRLRRPRGPRRGPQRRGSTAKSSPAGCGPSATATHGLPRLVRDMARSLGKEARLVVAGDRTEVDRDILEKLESPLVAPDPQRGRSRAGNAGHAGTWRASRGPARSPWRRGTAPGCCSSRSPTTARASTSPGSARRWSTAD